MKTKLKSILAIAMVAVGLTACIANPTIIKSETTIDLDAAGGETNGVAIKVVAEK